MKSEDRIVTIPNILSAFRILLIPLFTWLYFEQEYIWTSAVLVFSGITDMADGYIARHFNATSNLGKILDPIADKLTQAVTLFCLVIRYPLMFLLLLVMFLKELFIGITGILAIKKTGRVKGAKWHGKVATILLYATLIMHVLWYDIPAAVSNISIMLCIIMVLISFVLYGKRNINAIIGGQAA